MEGRNSKKAQVIKAEMEIELQDEAINTAAEACDRYDELSEVIEFVKKEFDKKHGSSWHCFAGTSFCRLPTKYGRNFRGRSFLELRNDFRVH
ncbi:hypothetical protein CRM22_010798 [Opisthorchis felineus]|uniref:Dynein light chain n=1 Tax=Opisthorchis felineus TaxID=147828 RepID=A0A4S2KL65_OPIFE|nr:hypothetical protein CRM22_010798 [Opisthorchis felineus]